MNETIWMCTEDFSIYPNREAARESYAKWCEDIGETFDEEIFKKCYKEVTFDYYNRNFTE